MLAAFLSVIPDAIGKVGATIKQFIPSEDMTADKPESATVNSKSESMDEVQETFDVRRPLSGILLKKNSFAYVKITDRKGNDVKVFNETHIPGTNNPSDEQGSVPNRSIWTDWILQMVSEDRAEKTQIVETFGEPFLYVFGQRPRALRFEGVLVNSANFNWRAQFWENWDKYMRATKLVENGHRLYVGFDDIIVEGYPINANAVQSGNDPHAIRFSFTLFVTGYRSTARIAVRPVNGEIIRSGDLTKSQEYILVNGKKISIEQFALLGPKISTREYVAKLLESASFGSLGGVDVNPVSFAFGELGGLTSFKSSIDVANKHLIHAATTQIDRYYRQALEDSSKRNFGQVTSFTGVTKTNDGVVAEFNTTSGGVAADTPEKINFWFGQLTRIADVLEVINPDLVGLSEVVGRPDVLAKRMAYASVGMASKAVLGERPDSVVSFTQDVAPNLFNILDRVLVQDEEDPYEVYQKAVEAQSAAASTGDQPGAVTVVGDVVDPYERYRKALAALEEEAAGVPSESDAWGRV